MLRRINFFINTIFLLWNRKLPLKAKVIEKAFRMRKKVNQRISHISGSKNVFLINSEICIFENELLIKINEKTKETNKQKNLRGMGCGGGGGGRHVYPWLIHVNVWWKSPQYCKVLSLQLK